MAKRNIISATAVQKRLKKLDELEEEVATLREEVAELRSILTLIAGDKAEPQKPTQEELGNDTWDPNVGPMPDQMKPNKKFHIAVKRRDDVKTIEKGQD
jgi:hypothetical protein